MRREGPFHKKGGPPPLQQKGLSAPVGPPPRRGPLRIEIRAHKKERGLPQRWIFLQGGSFEKCGPKKGALLLEGVRSSGPLEK